MDFKQLQLVDDIDGPVPRVGWNRNAEEQEKITTSVAEIISDIKTSSFPAILTYAKIFKDIPEEAEVTDIILTRNDLLEALNSLPQAERECLERVAERIRIFAEAQLACIKPLSLSVPGGTVGHDILPVEAAGCYAPGGHFSLPSTALMTLIPARVAGVKTVILASPKPTTIMKAAAALADADALLVLGGPVAIAALRFGFTGGDLETTIPSCDVIVGPGNSYVAEAKRQLSGEIRIDMIAGPSELVVVADGSADARCIAWDLLAQAEHDSMASVVLLTDSPQLLKDVNMNIQWFLSHLTGTSQNNAVNSLKDNSRACLVKDLMKDAAAIVNNIAPEHLEVAIQSPHEFLPRVKNAGAVFVGYLAAEVFGDYGIGPNHTLPTGGSAKQRGGLSVMDFVRVRTWTNISDCVAAESMLRDSVTLSRLEGLEAHAKSAECRSGLTASSSESKRKEVIGNVAGSFNFLRVDAESLMTYHPVKPIEVIAQEIRMDVEDLAKLNGNENVYGIPVSLIEGVEKRLHESAQFYPDPAQSELRQKLSEFTGRQMKEIICGAGGDDIIQLIIEICRPTGVVVSTPCFPMYDFFCRISRVPVHSINSLPDLSVDIDAVIQRAALSKISMVFLASPNNPTGLSLSHDSISQLCSNLPNCLIIIDEAYIEFSDNPSCISLLDNHCNLFVIRTFSKWAGLAGVRCGYGIGHPTIVNLLFQVKIPYNLSILSSYMGCSALANVPELMARVNLLKTERKHLAALFQSEQVFPMISTVPSDANFILCRVNHVVATQNTNCSQRTKEDSIVKTTTAKEIHSVLWRAGILTRFYDIENFQNFIRISCGREQDTRRLLSTLSSFSNVKAGPLKAILWDMDGVLADVAGSYRTCISFTSAHFGGEPVSQEQISREKARGGCNNDWQLTQRLIKEQTGKEIPLEEVTAIFQQEYKRASKFTPYFEPLLVSKWDLEHMAATVPMAVVTGRPRVEAEAFLKTWQIYDMFSCIYCMEDAHPKPSPDGLLQAIKCLDVPEDSSVLMIGDTVDDMRAAIAATEVLASASSRIVVEPIGVLSPFDAKCRYEETVAELYDAGAVLVGLRWDVILALGVPDRRTNMIRVGDGLSIEENRKRRESSATGDRRNVERIQESIEQCQQKTTTSSALTSEAIKVARRKNEPTRNRIPDIEPQEEQTPAAGCGVLRNSQAKRRVADVERITKETKVSCSLDLDGTGIVDCRTGVAFLDHMIDQLGKHGRFDLKLRCQGDLHIDDHHTVEDTAIVLGETFHRAIGDKRGIARFGCGYAPMDEVLCRAVVDMSGRGCAEVNLGENIRDKVGTLSTEMVPHFIRSFASSAKASIHVDCLKSGNSHHVIEAVFKALALALRHAVYVSGSELPSTKGSL